MCVCVCVCVCALGTDCMSKNYQCGTSGSAHVLAGHRMASVKGLPANLHYMLFVVSNSAGGGYICTARK